MDFSLPCENNPKKVFPPQILRYRSVIPGLQVVDVLYSRRKLYKEEGED